MATRIAVSSPSLPLTRTAQVETDAKATTGSVVSRPSTPAEAPVSCRSSSTERLRSAAIAGLEVDRHQNDPHKPEPSYRRWTGTGLSGHRTIRYVPARRRATPTIRSGVIGVSSRPSTPRRSMTTEIVSCPAIVAATTPAAPRLPTGEDHGGHVDGSHDAAADHVVPRHVPEPTEPGGVTENQREHHQAGRADDEVERSSRKRARRVGEPGDNWRLQRDDPAGGDRRDRRETDFLHGQSWSPSQGIILRSRRPVTSTRGGCRPPRTAA